MRGPSTETATDRQAAGGRLPRAFRHPALRRGAEATGPGASRATCATDHYDPEMRALIAALGAALLTLAGPAASSAGTSSYFETPSKNIVCGYFTGAGVPTLLECGVASGLIPPAPKPAGGCHVVDPASDRVRLNPAGRTYGFCSGDVGVLAEQGMAPALPYGTTWHKGAYSCASALRGLTCKNSSGHGFFLSRQSWHSF